MEEVLLKMIIKKTVEEFFVCLGAYYSVSLMLEQSGNMPGLTKMKRKAQKG